MLRVLDILGLSVRGLTVTEVVTEPCGVWVWVTTGVLDGLAAGEGV